MPQSLMDQLSVHVRHGDHLCVVCEDPEVRLGAAAQYLADGLRNNEFVMYAAPAATCQALRQRLASLGIDVDAALASGALRLPTDDDAYLSEGVFDPDAVFRAFESAIENAEAAGFAGSRLGGEPLWALERTADQAQIIAFERRLNGLFGKHKAAGFCVYDRRKWPDAMIFEVLRTHPIVVVDDVMCHHNLFFEGLNLVGEGGSPQRRVDAMLSQVREFGRGQARHKLALEAGRLGAWELDVRTDTSVRSPLHDQIFGYDRLRPNWGFDIFIEHVLPEDRPHVEASFQNALEEGTTWHFQARIKRYGDGAIRWIEAHGQPYPEGSRGARVQHLLGIVADVTERKELESALREADRRKDLFLATLAHELRNPLAPIANALQVIRQLGQSADARLNELYDIIERQSTQLTRLVDDLVDISRISTGRLNLHRSRLRLQDVLDSAVEAVQPLVQAQKHTLSVSVPAESCFVDGDPARLAQVFLNLLNNAAKYTPPGGRIELTAARAGDALTVAVRDDGAGIEPELLGKIFDMFVQGHEAGARVNGGLGIGLALTRQLLEMHEGSITARSDGPGHGSEFVVRLPAAPAPVAVVEQEDVASTRGTRRRRILVVDDNEDAARTLALALEQLGHAVITRFDGRTALAAIEAERPELAILDIGLPDLDGYEVARRVRQAQGENITLVALTGWGQAADRQRAREAGFDLHRTKPIESGALMEAIAALG